MVGRQKLSVLLVGQDHVALPIQGPADIDGSAVGTCLPLRQLTLGTLEVHESVLLRSLCNTQLREQLGKPNSGPHAVAHGCAAPVEAHSLLRHVLLLPPIAGANEGDRDGCHGAPVSGSQLVHGQLAGLRHPGDLQAMLCPGDLGHRPMVPDHVNGRRRDPARLLQELQGRLSVERVTSSEPNTGNMPLDPVVRRVGISLVHL
mmetsp:Transcript_26378/g.42258  ORF Transcript_26378/g.42258 Transcript_26378/m.42258 type:complete len:203 (+) Transcript_26378:384-992(+)